MVLRVNITITFYGAVHGIFGHQLLVQFHLLQHRFSLYFLHRERLECFMVRRVNVLVMAMVAMLVLMVIAIWMGMGMEMGMVSDVVIVSAKLRALLAVIGMGIDNVIMMAMDLL